MNVTDYLFGYAESVEDFVDPSLSNNLGIVVVESDEIPKYEEPSLGTTYQAFLYRIDKPELLLRKSLGKTSWGPDSPGSVPKAEALGLEDVIMRLRELTEEVESHGLVISQSYIPDYLTK